MTKTPFPIFLLALLIVLAGCTGGQNKNGAAQTGADNDSVNGIPLPPRQEGVSFLDPSVAKGRFAPVHFAFDSFSVSPEDAGTVQAVASFLEHAPNSVIVAGFTDERGTPGYNRALGEKRAGAVREALIAAGVSPARIQTVSFGAEMPVNPASDEAAWAANRRAEFGITRQ
jgi:peptidoglycan-associated lipoprotein